MMCKLVVILLIHMKIESMKTLEEEVDNCNLIGAKALLNASFDAMAFHFFSVLLVFFVRHRFRMPRFCFAWCTSMIRF